MFTQAKPMSEEALNPPNSMMSSDTLTSLLRRHDVWKGHSQSFVSQEVVSTGKDDLDKILLHKGWPKSCLIECIQADYAAVWFVFSSVLKSMSDQGLIALLNPPATPYAVGLIQQSIDLDALVVVRPNNKADFIASFVDLAKSQACSLLMAWQPQQNLSYAELRKCQLATLESKSLSFLYRHQAASQQSSPAALRLRFVMQARSLTLEFLKQKGKLPGERIELPLPDEWFDLADYKDLDLHIDEPLYLQAQATPWLNQNKPKLVPLRAYQNKKVVKV